MEEDESSLLGKQNFYTCPHSSALHEMLKETPRVLKAHPENPWFKVVNFISPLSQENYAP